MRFALHKTIFLIIFFICPIFNLFARVQLPKLISDGMVLQRNEMLHIWGWASPDENIKLHFIDSSYSLKADEQGNWKITIPPQKAGGPYEMKIIANNEIIIKDILIGEVWLCGGQSNMELPFRRVRWNYPDEIANCENSHIRQFKVPQKYDFNNKRDDLESGEWVSVNPYTILNFSAVAYFYAKQLFEQYKVPVGLINASLGGSPVEAWMSEKELKNFPERFRTLQQFKDSLYIDSIKKSDNNRINKWYAQSSIKDIGYESISWKNINTDVSGWKPIQVPGYWHGTELEGKNGVFWFQKKFTASKLEAKQESTLVLGAIVDADSVFINGEYIGNTTYRYPPRRYAIPKGILREGENVLTVRVISNLGTGGFVPDKQYQILGAVSNIDLSGGWLYRIGTTMEPLRGQTFIQWQPAGLYNAMIAPLVNYKIKGVIWYQGESNTEQPGEYAQLFPAMIMDWRNSFEQGDFPFLFVQLANFMEAYDQPSESNWAQLRSAQLNTLDVPNTGMAVIIDIGEWNDIHPLNKFDVGNRLSLLARKIAYGENDLVASGPVYQSSEILGDTVVISFTEIGSGLSIYDGDKLNQFAIAAADRNYVWAKAVIKNEKVYVWNDSIKNPEAVRYAWADNPEGANLINKEGLPASPFTTDESIDPTKEKANKKIFIAVIGGLLFLLMFLGYYYRPKPSR